MEKGGGDEGGGKVRGGGSQHTELCFSAMYCSQVSRRSGEFWYLQIQQCTSHVTFVHTALEAKGGRGAVL